MRGCATANPGLGPNEGLAPGWHSPSTGAIVAGPITWPYLRLLAQHSGGLAPRHGLAPGVKALIVVAAGAVVRVGIPANESARLSLDYSNVPPRNARQNLFRVADGASRVTFKACASGQGPQTEFAGGFLVAGAQCARIDIYTSVSNRPIRRQIAFGVPQRSCPADG